MVSHARVREDRQRDLRRRLDRPLARGRCRHPVHRRARAAAAPARRRGWRGSCWPARCRSRRDGRLGGQLALDVDPARRRRRWSSCSGGVGRAVPVAARARLRVPRRPPAVAALAARWRSSRWSPAPASLLLLPLQPTLEGRTATCRNPLAGRRPSWTTCSRPCSGPAGSGCWRSLFGGALALRARYRAGEPRAAAARSCGSPTARCSRRCGWAATSLLEPVRLEFDPPDVARADARRTPGSRSPSRSR